jgi:hypothetical protein
MLVKQDLWTKGQGSCPDYGVEKEKGRARTRFLSPRRGAR